MPVGSASTSFTCFVGRLFQRAPMFRVSLAMAVGIILGDAFCPFPSWIIGLLIGVGAGLMVLSLRRGRRGWLSGAAVWITCVFVGWLLACIHVPEDPFAGQGELRDMALSVCLKTVPTQSENCYKVVAEVDTVAGRPSRGRVMLFIAKDSLAARLQAGDRLRLVATPSMPSGAENPYQFDYRRYLRRHKVLWQCYLPRGSWQRATEEDGSVGMQIRLARFQQSLVGRIKSLELTPQQQGIAEAFLLGWREDVDDTMQRQFRGAGIMHLLCVSGLHVGLMAAFVGGIFFFLGRRRWQRTVKGLFQLLAVWFYVILTGMASATLRAGLMFSLMIVGDMMEQRPNTLNNLATSAVMVFCFSPMQLYDVGFQLSYSAVLGILALHQPLCALLPMPKLRFKPFPWFLRKVWGWLCLSTAAQLATMPFVLYYFHQFPVYFLIANLLIVPFAGVLLFTALMAVLTNGVGWICSLLRAELAVVDGLTQWISSLPSALLTNIYCDWVVELLIIVGLLSLVVLIRGRFLFALPMVSGCLFLVVVYGVFVGWQASRQQEVVVYSAGRYLAVECLHGRRSYLVCDSDVAADAHRIDYQRSGVLLRKRIRETVVLPVDTTYYAEFFCLHRRCILFGGQKIMIVDSTNAAWLNRCGEPSPELERIGFNAVVVAPRTLADTVNIRRRLRCDTIYLPQGQ